MKIYIVGSVASGKSTLARKLSKITGISCTHLDGLIHIKDKSNKKWGNTRRSEEETEDLFAKLMKEPSWLIEDAGRLCFSEGFDKADKIIHLKPSLFIRKTRIFTRYIKQKLGIEDCLYTPNLRMVKFLYGALDNYERGDDNLEKRLEAYSAKTVTLVKQSDITSFITEINSDWRRK
ncbi:DNA topology modulation protein FlaR [Acidaminobacter sp. JC074]|uniref:hypothetical protein n=1 Tax=Acidaminobacter sp. JC074 TaxID=2530199 RepID=UPI001F0CE432|nr:hypothetical protein [Acidaminobacter sp. JC074]MCH4886832.1 DNA topology modulation protein FlaR [Acidaminobacter sp. JC074]